MLIVRFVRKDKRQSEEYYYQRISDALYHMSLFEHDKSEYYERIELLVELSEKEWEVVFCSNPNEKITAD